jgi:predicted PurR-regulated permease PerM
MHKHLFKKIFFIGIVLIVLQSFLQQSSGFLGVLSTIMNYLEPFAYALLISILANPLMKFFEDNWRMKRIFSLILTILVIIALITGAIFMVIPGLISSFKEVSASFPQLIDSFNKITTDILVYLERRDLLIFDMDNIRTNFVQIFKDNLGNLKIVALSVGANLVSFTIWLGKFLTGAFIATIILYNREYFVEFTKNLILLFVPKEKQEEAYNLAVASKNIFMKYILGRALVSAIVGLVCFLIMFFTGVPYAVLNGILFGIGNMIPYIGTIVAGILAVILVGLTDPIKIIYLGIAVAAAQAVDGFIIGPKIGSEAVGMSTFWVIVGVLLGGSLWGIPGTILGVPVLGVIKLIYLHELQKKKGEK